MRFGEEYSSSSFPFLSLHLFILVGIIHKPFLALRDPDLF